MFLVLTIVGLTFPADAEASFCTWNLHCVVTCDENGENCETDCTITGYWCLPSQGDCESICDWEQTMCETECVLDEEGDPQQCASLCRKVFRECNKKCIPSL